MLNCSSANIHGCSDELHACYGAWRLEGRILAHGCGCMHSIHQEAGLLAGEERNALCWERTAMLGLDVGHGLCCSIHAGVISSVCMPLLPQR